MPAFKKKRSNGDHLGNIRLSYSDINNDGSITASTEIQEENNYYPFGLKHKGYNNVQNGRDHKFGFGNKEEQDELGLGWIDITARNYDPALGRWMNLDPLADQMRRHSPYNYAFDNPIFFIDADGMMPEGTIPDISDLSKGIDKFDKSNPLPKNENLKNFNPVERHTKGPGDPKKKNGTTTVTVGQISYTPKALPKVGGETQSKLDGFMSRLGLVASGTSSFISDGAFTQTNGKIGNFFDRPFNKLSANAKANFSFSKNIKFAGNLITGLTLGYSSYQTFTGQASTESLTFDATMAGTATVPLIGIPLSLIGTYYKEELLNLPKVTQGFGPNGTTCFIKGTKVLMADFTEKNIETIKVGDKILSININTMEIEPDLVVNIPNTIKKYKVIEAKFQNGISNKFSPAHPFWVENKGWSVFDTEEAKTELTFKVNKLEKGDVVFYYHKGKLKRTTITSILDTGDIVEMYNVEYVKKNHTFFANSILVHNKNE